MNEHNLLKRIETHLPERVPIRLRGEADFYGLSHQIANLTGRKQPPHSRIGWQHGWVVEPIEDPRQVAGNLSPEQTMLVANRSIADFLNRHDYNAYAAGLPLIYSETFDVPRIPGSMLVMPAHVTKHSSQNRDESSLLREIDYVDYILDVARDFDFVITCLSQQCIDRGIWVDTFRKHGIPVIAGAGIDDRNSLTRIRSLLSQFEVVTSNAAGSHLLYAAYCGCRVSLSGPEHRMEHNDFATEPFYMTHPDLIDKAIARTSREFLRQWCPQLFDSPAEAKPCLEWAQDAMGSECRLDPNELSDHLQWGSWDRFRNRTIDVIEKNFLRRVA